MTCPFLVMNGDILTNFNVNQMFSFHDDRRAEMTVGVRHYSMQVPYGVAEVDNGFITELSEKPVFDFFVNAGIYVVEPSALDLIPDEGYFDITELIDRLLDRGASVASFPIIERWMDIGKPEDVERANDMIEKGT
jgi:NDP-sugar pyrophosphorylase family protein